MEIKKFQDVEAWKQARKLNYLVYDLMSIEKFRRDWVIKDQLLRASLSIMSNIAEGFDSGSPKCFINFLNISFRSASEVKSILYVALDRKYLLEKDFNELISKVESIQNLIGGFIQYLKKYLKLRTKNKELK